MNLNGREINDLNDLEQAIRDGVPGAAELAASLEEGAYPGFTGASYAGPSSFPTPADDAGITSLYGPRTHPVTRQPGKLHTGIDIGDPGPGNLAGEPAVSIAPGTVVSAGPAGGYGNQVAVQHPDGSASTYSHLDSITVEPGQEVAAGWEVGKIGSTSSTGSSTGPHLHLEVFDPAGNRIDPNSLVSSLQTASQIASGNTTANAVGQYGPETAVLGPSLQTPLADAPLVAQEALPPLQTAFTPFTPSPNLAALPAAQAIEGIRVGSPTLPPTAIAQPTPVTSPPITQRAISVGPLPAATSPALPAARSPSLPVANSPPTTPVVGGQPVEEFGPPASLAGAPSFDDRMAASQQRLREALEALPGGPVTPQPISVGTPSPVLGALSNDPLSRPFSLPAAQIAELSAARPLSPITAAQPISPSVAARPLSPTVAAQPIQVGITASTTPLPRAAAGPVQDVLPSTAPVGPFPARPEAPLGGFPVAEAPGLIDVFGPLFTQSAPAVPPSSPGPTAFLTSPEANPAYAPSVPAPALSPSFQSAFGPEQALKAGIKIGATPWDTARTTYNPPDLIAGPAAPLTEPTPRQIVDAYPDDFFHTPVDGLQHTPTPVAAPGVPTGIEVGAAKPLPVVQVPGAPAAPATAGAPPTVQAPVQKPAPVPSTPDLVSAAVAPDLQEMTQPITVGPKPNVGLRAPIGTQDLISGAVGGLLGGPVGAIAAPLGQRMLGSLGNLMGNPIQRMMEERERQRLEAEEHGISVGLGYGGPTSGMGRAFAGGGGGYERSFGVGPIGGFSGPSWADKANYGR